MLYPHGVLDCTARRQDGSIFCKFSENLQSLENLTYGEQYRHTAKDNRLWVDCSYRQSIIKSIRRAS